VLVSYVHCWHWDIMVFGELSNVSVGQRSSEAKSAQEMNGRRDDRAQRDRLE
jgi:hypothetical protein